MADTGPAIPLDAHIHLFDAFWQKHPEAALSSPGTGLGLPIARRLARLLGGDVELISGPDSKGNIFRLTLPARYTPMRTQR